MTKCTKRGFVCDEGVNALAGGRGCRGPEGKGQNLDSSATQVAAWRFAPRPNKSLARAFTPSLFTAPLLRLTPAPACAILGI